MENNQNNTISAFTNPWNLEKMETNEQNHFILQQNHHDQHQIPMSSSIIWRPNNYNMIMASPGPSQMQCQLGSCTGPQNFEVQPPPSDILGIHHQIEDHDEEDEEEELGAMKEMMYKIAAMQPVDIDPATIRKPKRRNVRISDDPQSVAARHRRERISEKIRILQRLVPCGTKMDTASMLDEAIRYVKFLKRQIRLLQSTPQNHQPLLPLSSQCMINSTSPSALLLSPNSSGCGVWPFAPNVLFTSTTTVSVDLPAEVQFDAGGGHSHVHACDGSSSFNHHEVIN